MMAIPHILVSMNGGGSILGYKVRTAAVSKQTITTIVERFEKRPIELGCNNWKLLGKNTALSIFQHWPGMIQL